MPMISDLSSQSNQPSPGAPETLPARRPVRILSANVAERIAAGEVIERPASVVKEMVENSLDAGATEVMVALEEGGKSLIEITDNGHGMTPEDLRLCIQRHATSKLSSVGDLERIRTLGFRGEALPSVAAVSELSILSRTAEAAEAHELRLPAVSDQERFEDRSFSPEPVTFGHFLNSRHGTRIQARGLFAQIPARLKFLKSQGAEVAQVREWIERLALAHPRVGFRLLSDGRQVLSLRPQDEKSRVRAILADGEDFPVLSAASDLGAAAGELGVPDRAGGLHVRVHWLQGLSSPQMRRIVQVVNGRAVRDRMLQQALLAPFRQLLLPGQFPAVALFIDIDPAQLDVNVHPTKTEIRFLESRRIFHAIDELIDSLIAREGAPAYAPGPSAGWRPAPATASAPWTMPPSASAPATASPTAWTVPPSARPPETAADAPSDPSSPPLELRPSFAPTPSWQASEPMPRHQTSFSLEAPLAADESTHPLRAGRLAGSLFNTYLLYEIGEELALVDQHAAHERIRYEQLRKRALRTSPDASDGTPAAQALLIPEAVKFDAELRPRFESRIAWLDQLGFETEVFGEDTALFRGVPAEWGLGNLRPRLKNLVDRVLECEEKPGLPLHLDEQLFERLASEACHSSVRAGDRLETEESSALVRQLFECEHPWNCPHGRPTVVRVPRARFEEWFLRRV